MKYAVFDIDGTLIKNDSLLIAAWFSNNKLQLIVNSIIFLPFYLFSKFGFISSKLLKEKFLKIFNICDLFNNPKKDKNKKLFQTLLKKNIRPEAIKRINFHKSLGHKVLLCSASPRMIIFFLSEFLDIDLICTELYRDQKNWIPKIIGKNCSGFEKVRKLEDYIGKLDKIDFHAYGDSYGDKELLEKSKWPHWRSYSDELKEYPKFSVTRILPLLILVLFIYISLIFKSVGFDILPILNNLKFEIVIGLMLILIGYLIRFFRWRIFMKNLNLDIPINDDLILWMGSFAFTATPAKAGEGLRSFLLKDKFDLPIEKTLGAIIMERFSDGLSVFLIILLNTFSIKGFKVYFFDLYLFFFILFLTIFSLKRFRLLDKFLKNIQLFFKNKIILSTINSFNYFIKLFNLRILIITTFLGSLSWSFEALSFWLILRGLKLYYLSYSDAMIVHLGSSLIGIISFIPGGIGASEAGSAGILFIKGVAFKDAMIATIIIRFMTIWFATFLGMLCLIIPFKKLTKLIQNAN